MITKDKEGTMIWKEIPEKRLGFAVFLCASYFFVY
jgi:hypothetical protein